MSEKLESFKIGEHRKANIHSVTAPKPAEKPATEAITAGFARIEETLDQEPEDQTLENLERIHRDLIAQEEVAQTPRAKAPFKKARLAVERTRELLEYLFNAKQAMMTEVAERSPTPGRER